LLFLENFSSSRLYFPIIEEKLLSELLSAKFNLNLEVDYFVGEWNYGSAPII